LLDYLFRHTFCVAVEATLNVENTPSIKLQEAVGGVHMDESTFQVPESMQNIMIPVHHYIYRLF
jgi:RimJ/RimL family protein N-acetyltransferase